MKHVKIFSIIMLCGSLILSGCGAGNAAKGTETGAGSGVATGAATGKNALGAAVGRKMEKQKKELESALPGDAKVEVVSRGSEPPALKVTFGSHILFATNSSAVSDASGAALRHIAAHLEKNPDTDVKVVGHTDSTGKADYNQTMSEKRAKSVYDFLLLQGVSSKRMRYEGRGIDDPVADNSTASGRAQNRRVEIHILAGEKMLNDARREAGLK